MTTTDRRLIGKIHDVTIELAGWDGVGAVADLSVACMFTREVTGNAMTGGLLHLDDRLDGRLSRLRADGIFAAEAMDMIVMDRPPSPIAARALLVVGLGDPEAWTPAVTARAVAGAFEIAAQRQAASVAFAPSLLDAGLDRVAGAPPAMIGGLAATLERAHSLVDVGLASVPTVTSWTFDAGAAHLDGAEAAFRQALASIQPS